MKFSEYIFIHIYANMHIYSISFGYSIFTFSLECKSCWHKIQPSYNPQNNFVFWLNGVFRICTHTHKVAFLSDMQNRPLNFAGDLSFLVQGWYATWSTYLGGRNGGCWLFVDTTQRSMILALINSIMFSFLPLEAISELL